MWKHFLDNYLNYRKESGKHDSVIICYSNKSANRYNRDIRIIFTKKMCLSGAPKKIPTF